MKSVLVLGGGGFLAGFIERHFAASGWRVVSVGREAGRSQADQRHAWSLPHPDLGHLLASEQPTLCVNAAGKSSVHASLLEPLADFEASTVLNFRVLDDLRRNSPETAYIQLSSAAVYGDPRRLPVNETAPIAPISPYGWHKHLSERVLEEHARQFGLKAASLRIFSAYGPGLRRQVIWDLVQRARQLHGQSLLLRGFPEDSRDFVHAEDVARAVDAVAEHGELTGEAYNVGAGCETPIAKIAELVLEEAGIAAEIRFDAQRPAGNPARWHADVSRLMALGFAPKVALSDGIAQVAAEARAHHG